MRSCFEPFLPEIVTRPPGPRSRDLANRLGRVECPDTTYRADDFPVFWERASGANVWDVDGNRYVDLTGGFGVAGVGHTHPQVTWVLETQGRRLVQGLGDVHPSELKVHVAEKLRTRTPGRLGVALFGSTGSDAVEAALKTAVLASGRPGIVAFQGAYHGLGYGALAVTWRTAFRGPFEEQLNPHVLHLPFPEADGGPDASAQAARVLDQVDRALGTEPMGAVLVEPIQGRAGVRVPHPSFLPGLREICTRRDRLLIADEILTGLGRTGRWFACEHPDVVPDLLCLGKSLAGGLPLSVCMGTEEVMAAWGRSTGEARHTSTFLGHPLACASALATLGVLEEEDWPGQVSKRGEAFGKRLATLTTKRGVASVRGLGFLWGLELETPDGGPDSKRAFAVVTHALRQGVLLLSGGDEHNVLSLTPPYCLDVGQQAAAFRVLETALDETEDRT